MPAALAHTREWTVVLCAPQDFFPTASTVQLQNALGNEHPWTSCAEVCLPFVCSPQPWPWDQALVLAVQCLVAEQAGSGNSAAGGAWGWVSLRSPGGRQQRGLSLALPSPGQARGRCEPLPFCLGADGLEGRGGHPVPSAREPPSFSGTRGSSLAVFLVHLPHRCSSVSLLSLPWSLCLLWRGWQEPTRAVPCAARAEQLVCGSGSAGEGGKQQSKALCWDREGGR